MVKMIYNKWDTDLRKSRLPSESNLFADLFLYKYHVSLNVFDSYTFKIYIKKLFLKVKEQL